MPLTKIQIASKIVELLGKNPITTFADAGKFGSTLESTYDLLIQSVLSVDNWRFATAIRPLSRLVATPNTDSGWSYAYQLPSDYLSLRRLYPHTTDFQIYENRLIYANGNHLTAEYRFKPDESRFPMYFVDYFIFEVAMQICISAGSDDTTFEKIEKLRIEKLKKALVADGMSHPSKPIQNNPVIDCRW